MKYFLSALCFLTAAVLLTSCSEISSNFLPDETSQSGSETTAPASEVSGGDETSPPKGEEIPQKIAVKHYEVTRKGFSADIEGEKGGLSGGTSVSSKRGKFSGTGYVTGFFQSTAASALFSLELPSGQHYDIRLYIRSDENARAYLSAGGEKYELALPATEEFYIYSLNAVYLEAGVQEIIVSGGFNSFELDRITVSASTALYDLAFDVAQSPINPNAAPEAKKLYSFLKDAFGKQCITGQYASSDKNIEARLIRSLTGRSPLMRLSDIASGYDEISAALDWSAQGGIVSLMWYWKSPIDEPSVYLSETDFDFTKAVTDKDVAKLPMEKLEQLYINGEIPRECLFLIREIDNISEQLKILADKGIPVLWRPLHEPDSNLYWWGKDAKSYKWLWQLMYTRQTEYSGLNNLLWVWNGSSAEYYVGDGLCDIASADSYISGPKQKTCADSFMALYSISKGKKLCALSECGALPEPDLLVRDRCVWSFFGLWYGDYIVTPSGELNESSITENQLFAVYNSELSLTLGDYN